MESKKHREISDIPFWVMETRKVASLLANMQRTESKHIHLMLQTGFKCCIRLVTSLLTSTIHNSLFVACDSFVKSYALFLLCSEFI